MRRSLFLILILSGMAVGQVSFQGHRTVIPDSAVTPQNLSESVMDSVRSIASDSARAAAGDSARLDDVTLSDVQSATSSDFHNIGGVDDDVPESGDFGNAVDLESDGSLSSGVVGNSNVSDLAAISGTKISPDFGDQLIKTTGNVEGHTLKGKLEAGSVNWEAISNSPNGNRDNQYDIDRVLMEELVVSDLMSPEDTTNIDGGIINTNTINAEEVNAAVNNRIHNNNVVASENLTWTSTDQKIIFNKTGRGCIKRIQGLYPDSGYIKIEIDGEERFDGKVTDFFNITYFDTSSTYSFASKYISLGHSYYPYDYNVMGVTYIIDIPYYESCKITVNDTITDPDGDGLHYGFSNIYYEKGNDSFNIDDKKHIYWEYTSDQPYDIDEKDTLMTLDGYKGRIWNFFFAFDCDSTGLQGNERDMVCDIDGVSSLWRATSTEDLIGAWYYYGSVGNTADDFQNMFITDYYGLIESSFPMKTGEYRENRTSFFLIENSLPKWNDSMTFYWDTYPSSQGPESETGIYTCVIAYYLTEKK
mgnify:CR=1 FL=1